MPAAEAVAAPWEGVAEEKCAPALTWRTGRLLPLDAPGMPPAGPDFLKEAARLVGDPPDKPCKFALKKPRKPKKSAPAEEQAAFAQALREYEEAEAGYRDDVALYQEAVQAHGLEITGALAHLYREALYTPGFQMEVMVKNRPRPAVFLTGHTLSDDPDAIGPQPARVLVLGRNPGPDSIAARCNLYGPRSASFFEACKDVGIPEAEVDSWYFTKVVKHDLLDPASDRLAAAWIQNCLPLLHQELRLVRPEFILCLGAEPAKTLLGETVSVSGMTGRVVDYEIPGVTADDPPTVARVMVVTSPKHVFAKPEAYPDLRDGIARFWDLVRGAWDGSDADEHQHEVIYTARRLRQVVDQIVADPAGNTIALDAEWHGRGPREPGAYLRTIQFSHKARTAYTVVLRSCGGVPAFQPSLEAALPELQRLCKSTGERPVRVGGHFFRADMPWLEAYGLDLKDEFAAPESPEAARTKGGFDTGYMLHAVYESVPEGYQLEPWAVRLTGVPRYDTTLRKWKEANPKLVADGYGWIPDAILHPYAAYDVDSTRRLFDVLNGVDGQPGLLDCDAYGLSSREGFFTSQGASLTFLEMEMHGLEVDRERGEELTQTFATVRNEKLEEFRAAIKWPDFNPGSWDQTREFLFGVEHNGKADPKTGKAKRLRPEGAVSLGLEPITTSGSRPKPWERVVEANEEDLYRAGTNKEVLGILGHDSPEVSLLRDVRFVGQVLKSVLRLPVMDKNTSQLVRDERGRCVYDGGLLSFMHADGRVHTSFYPVETGRCSSSRPALQNISKSRESDYARILGKHYKYACRSMLRAGEGCVLVEADYKSAEMAAIAWLANDRQMIEDVTRNQLPEDHPDFLDPHSQLAVRAFQLDCAPNKAGLKSIGKSALRTAAKTIIYGLPYGRGDEAMARKCREEGASVSTAQVTAIRAGYFDSYPEVGAYLEECALRPLSPGWIRGPFGRCRRFPPAPDREILENMKREAKNYGIQSTVADAISTAMRNLYEYRAAHSGPETFFAALQIHDALILEVPIDSVEWVVEDVLPTCMCAQVPIYPCNLDGERLEGVGPYRFGIDTEVQLRWGEALAYDRGKALGIPDKYLKAA